MPNYLVTGGAGFIGSHLVEALAARGDTVRVLDNLSTGCLDNLSAVNQQIEFLNGDLVDQRIVAQAVRDIDVIFHQAALASVPLSVEAPLQTHAACVTGTVNLLDQARRAGVRRLVYAGSSSVYGDQPILKKRESDLPCPLSPYAAAKMAAENYCHAFYQTYGLETVVVRYFNVFGPRQDPDSPYSAVIPIFIKLLLCGQRPTIYGDGTQTRDFTFVDDVIRGNLLAAETKGAAGRSFNVATGRAVSLLDLVTELNRLLKTNVKPVHTDSRPGDVLHSLADISAARVVLEYEPQVDFQMGLDRSIEYYRSIST